MTDDTQFIEWLKQKGFKVIKQDGEGVFRYTRLANENKEILIAHDAKIKNRSISYFYLYDNGKVIKRIEPIEGKEEHFMSLVQMWELPISKDQYEQAINGELKTVA